MFSEKIINLFKENRTKYYYKPTRSGGNEPRKPKIKKSIRRQLKQKYKITFKLKKENEVKKGRIVREIRTFFN